MLFLLQCISQRNFELVIQAQVQEQRIVLPLEGLAPEKLSGKIDHLVPVGTINLALIPICDWARHQQVDAGCIAEGTTCNDQI